MVAAPRREEGPGAARVDDHRRPEFEGAPIVAAGARAGGGAVLEEHVLGVAALVHLGAERGGAAEQKVVEVGARHVPGPGARGVVGVLEGETLPAPGARASDGHAVLAEVAGVEVVGEAEVVEHLARGRRQRLAHVKPRKTRAFDDDDVQAAAREERGGSRSRGAAADHEHVAASRGHHRWRRG